MKQWMITVLAMASCAGCFHPQECTDDSDCAEGMVCSTTSGAYEVRVCTQPLEGQRAQGCLYACNNANTVVGASFCELDGVTVCVLDCPDSTQSCDDDMQNGCESDSMSDLNNCGACGNDCAAQFGANNVTGTCDAGSCVPTACAETWVDVNADLEDGCSLSFDKNALSSRNMEVSATVGVVRARGVTAVVDADGAVNTLPDDTSINTATFSSAGLASVSGVRGTDSGLGRIGAAVLVGDDGTDPLAEVVLWNSDGALELVDTFPGVVAADLVSSMKVDVEAEDYVFDVFAMTGQTLTWYAYLRSGKAAADVFGEDKTCVELTVSVLSNLKRCEVGTVTDLGTLLGGTPEHVRVKRSRPGGDVILMTSGSTVREVRAFIQNDGGDWLRSLDERNTSPANPEVATVLDVELWRDVDGSLKGIAVAGVSGGTLQVEFIETVETGTEVTSREQRKLVALDTSVSAPLDLVPFGEGRFVLVNDKGLFVASSRDGEELVRLSDEGDTSWDAGDEGGGSVSVTRNGELYLIPVP